MEATDTPEDKDKGLKKVSKPKEKRSGKRNREICDVFGEHAMINAYNISHNVQDFLSFRGFSWANASAHAEADQN